VRIQPVYSHTCAAVQLNAKLHAGVGSEATCPNDSAIKPNLAQPEDDFITVSKEAIPIFEQNNINEECTKLNAGGSELDASRGADCSDQGAAQTDLEADTDANAGDSLAIRWKLHHISCWPCNLIRVHHYHLGYLKRGSKNLEWS